ncbi:hypothetical protein BGX23_003871 [Mortierella sp. AD031]|nr:hypothetical protein BGX23_003871 [Mortierella sp. AD031]
MKPANQKKPLQSRHRVNANAAAAAAANGQQQATPAVPRMLRRMTKQSFMDVDLQYLMKLDPTTPDPFENSSPVFEDPPSLFRPLPASIAGKANSKAIARLQKEQEDLRAQYLSFLHQLHQSNPHGFLVHMNTFAAEFPQEFTQLQAYIRYQEQVVNQQREEVRRVEEMRAYQAQLEERHREEQERKRIEELFALQNKEEQVKELQRSRDAKFVEKMMASGGQGLDVLLSPAQQQEFWLYMEEKRTREMLAQEKKRRDLASAGFSSLVGQQQQQQQQSLFGSSSSSSLFGNAFSIPTGTWTGLGGIGGTGTSSSANGGLFGGINTPVVFPSQFQPPMTNEQYLKRNSRGSSRR